MSDPFTSLWRWLFGPRLYRMQVFMKSGNSFVLDGVKEYEIVNQGEDIARLHLKQAENRNRLLVKTVALSQIEAVVLLSGRKPA